MGYMFEVEETVEAGIRRIATELIDDSISRIEDRELDRHETVHEVRKNCKKMRGLLRLARPALGDAVYREENARFREAARSLSALRDAEAMIETYDDLMTIFGGLVDLSKFNTIRGELERRKAVIAADEGELERRLEAFLAEMRDARVRVQEVRITGQGFGALAGGFERIYARGQHEMLRARREPTTEHVHEWRKRAKYHWYHVRLLQYVWRPVVSPLADELDVLSDLLGDEHNLAVLESMMLAEPEAFGEERVIQAMLGLTGRRRAELREMAWPLGQRVYAEKPKSITGRFEQYWDAWLAGHHTSPLFHLNSAAPLDGMHPNGQSAGATSPSGDRLVEVERGASGHVEETSSATTGTSTPSGSAAAGWVPLQIFLALERLVARQVSVPAATAGRFGSLGSRAKSPLARAAAKVESSLAQARSVARSRRKVMRAR